MNCEQARAVLWPPERPRLVGGDSDEARRHVRDCEICAEYFAQDRTLLDLYDRARRASAPTHVKERVFDALARARWDTIGQGRAQSAELADRAGGGQSRRAGLRPLLTHGAWPAALVALLALVAVAGLRPRAKPAQDDPGVFVEDYLRRAVGQDHIETNDAAEVTRFLQRELGLRVEPIELPGLNLERAEICLLEGRRGAMIVYKHNGAVVSHYLVPRENAIARAPALSEHAGGRVAADMPVVTWATPNVEQALVGEVDASELLEIAERGSVDP